MSLEADFATLRESLSFFVSVIRSGEAFTETVMAQDIDASSALARVEAELSRLREQRAALATRLRDGAEHGETTEIRAWCLLALGES